MSDFQNFDIKKHTILRVRHGSHAYGLNIATSDLDIKGVCIEPKEYHFGFLRHFEQHEMYANKGADHDEVIYSLKKFFKLASDCNPNIIEILFVNEDDVIDINEFGQELRAHRDKFLSKKARWTFSGYAHSQLKRIKSHRNWLLNPPQAKPERTDFGLSTERKLSSTEMGMVEKIIQNNSELSSDIESLYFKEKNYKLAKDGWDQYQDWKKNRNPDRAELEKKFGYDTKHATHLIRLMRMCKEILQSGLVQVKRPDRDQLLEIRSGNWSYDRLIEHATLLEEECAQLYETSSLPHKADGKFLDNLLVNLTEEFLKKNSSSAVR